MDETVTPDDVDDILRVFDANDCFNSLTERIDFDKSKQRITNNEAISRTSTYLQHPIFNSHHSEAELVRYMKILENKDVSLVHSMVNFIMSNNFRNVFHNFNNNIINFRFH